jgi:c-di-AMP phosphodiesterase-like protein
VVDFAYKRAIMEDMASSATSLLVLDHHKSAQDDLAGLDFAVFDMNRSGAGLAWDWFHPQQKRPALVDFVEDGDLWRHALLGTREFQLRLTMEPKDFSVWDRIAAMSESELQGFVQEGGLLKRSFDKDVQGLLEDRYVVTLAGETGLAVNAHSAHASELGNYLAGMSGTFGMVWRQVGDRLKVSLRSCGDYDVTILAGKFGGGGHRNAAAFSLPVSPESYAIVNGKSASA